MTSAKALTLTAAAVAIGVMAIPDTGQARCVGAECYSGHAMRTYYYRTSDYTFYGPQSGDYAYAMAVPAALGTRYTFEPHAYGFVADQPYSTLYAYGYASGLRSAYGCLWYDRQCPW